MVNLELVIFIDHLAVVFQRQEIHSFEIWICYLGLSLLNGQHQNLGICLEDFDKT